MSFALKQAFHDLRMGSDNVDLEQRLFRLLCVLTGALLLVIVVPLNMALRLSPLLIITAGISGVAALALYALAVRGTLFLRSYLALVALVLNVGWFTEGGTEGSIGYFFFVVVVYTGFFFRGSVRWVFLALFAFDGLALLAAAYLHPEWTVGFPTPLDRITDLTTGFIVSTIGLALMVLVIRTGFDGERRRQEELNRRLADALELNQRRTVELAASFAEVKTLRGLLPICSNCKRVRDDAGLWSAVEHYVSSHSDASFTHSLCPDCLRRLYPGYADAVMAEMNRPVTPTTDDVVLPPEGQTLP